MRLTKEKVEQINQLFQREPDLEFIDLEEGDTDGKLRAFKVQTVEKRSPVALREKSARY